MMSAMVRGLMAAIVLLVLVGATAGASYLHSPRDRHSAEAARARPVSFGAAGPIVAPGFVGLSMETDGLTTSGGPSGPFDPVLAQLIKNLSPGARPVLRIGGDSTDYSWSPIPGVPRPPGVHYSLTSAWLREVRQLAQATDARLIVGINLQADSRRVAVAEARAVVDGIGSQSILGLEPGNEPELYRSVTAATTPATPPAQVIPRRFAAFARVYSGLTNGLPGGALAGPSIGSDKWLPYLRPFLRREPRVRVVTVHRYPLKHCGGGGHNTISDLLSESSSRGLAQSLVPSIRTAHAAGRTLRVDELNSVSCGGEAGVSDTFASALWSLDTLFEMARVGVDGVNVHTRPLSFSQLFNLSRSGSVWRAAVRPEYYGLLTFALAAPAGSRLLRVSQPPTKGFQVWATRTASGTVHVVLINETERPHTFSVKLPARGSFTAMVLRAGRLGATAGVTLGGESFRPGTTTGLLAGAPQSRNSTPVNGVARVQLPASSAVLLSDPA
jgi:hypothetical protein